MSQFARNSHLHEISVARFALQPELVVKLDQVVFAVEGDLVTSNGLANLNQGGNDDFAQLFSPVGVVDNDVLDNAPLRR